MFLKIGVLDEFKDLKLYLIIIKIRNRVVILIFRFVNK